MNPKNLPIILPLVTALLGLGCSDDRAVQISREAADRQAAQNREMAQLNREVTIAHRELTELQQGVQVERSNLNTGWTDLEAQRRQIARDRRTESFLAALVLIEARRQGHTVTEQPLADGSLKLTLLTGGGP